MRKLSAFLTATLSEFGILLLITGLLSPLSPYPEIPQKPLMVKLSIISFRNPSTTQRIVTTYPETGPLMEQARERIEAPEIGNIPVKDVSAPKRAIHKIFELPEIKDKKKMVESTGISYLTAEQVEEPAATRTSQMIGKIQKGVEVSARIPKKKMLVSKKVEFEMPTGVFKAEEFFNFYEVKEELERKYRELLNRRKMDRAILEGSVEAVLILKTDGSVDVQVKKASAVELEGLVISALSKLRTRRHVREQKIKVVINLGGRVAVP